MCRNYGCRTWCAHETEVPHTCQLNNFLPVSAFKLTSHTPPTGSLVSDPAPCVACLLQQCALHSPFTASQSVQSAPGGGIPAQICTSGAARRNRGMRFDQAAFTAPAPALQGTRDAEERLLNAWRASLTLFCFYDNQQRTDRCTHHLAIIFKKNLDRITEGVFLNVKCILEVGLLQPIGFLTSLAPVAAWNTRIRTILADSNQKSLMRRQQQQQTSCWEGQTVALDQTSSVNLRDFDLSDAPSRHPFLRPLRSGGETWRSAGDWPLTTTSGHLLGIYLTYWGYPGRMVSTLHGW